MTENEQKEISESFKMLLAYVKTVRKKYDAALSMIPLTGNYILLFFPVTSSSTSGDYR